MELYQLRTFVTVADEMHMGRAAGRLHLTQPSLSRQIVALERDVGVELFSRAHRRLQLTAAGEAFRDEVQELLRRADHAKSTARRAARGEIGSVTLGFVQSARYAVLPRLVRAFREESPQVRLDATPMTTLQQIRAIRAGVLDAGLLRPRQPSLMQEPDSMIDLEFRHLSEDSMVVAVPSGHPLAQASPVPLGQLAGESFVLYPPESGSTGYDLIIEHCLRAGFNPDVVQHANDAATIVALVAAGLGVSILIGPPPPIDPELVAYLPITDDLPSWELALAWSPDNPSPALHRLASTELA